MTDFVINKSTVNCWWYNPEVHQKQPLDFGEQRTLIFYANSGKGKTPLASCLAVMVARDVGLDEFVMVSSPDMLRSAVERNLLRDERPLLLDELQISSSNIGAQGGGVHPRGSDGAVKDCAREAKVRVLAVGAPENFLMCVGSAPPSRNLCFSSSAEAAVSSSTVLPASRVAYRIWRP